MRFRWPKLQGALMAMALSCASLPLSAMQIYVVPTTNLTTYEPDWSFTRLTLDVEPSDPIEFVKLDIYSLDPLIVVDRQVLFFQGQLLEDGRSLADYNIQKEQTLVLGSTREQGIPEPATGLLMLSGMMAGWRVLRGNGRQGSKAA